MSRKNNILLAVLFAIGLGIVASQIFHVKADVGIPGTPDAKQIMATMNRAYQVLGRTSQTFDISEFPSVFIDTEDYKLTDDQQKTVADALGLSVSEVKNAGYLTAMQAKYISRAQGAKLLQEAIKNAKAENRDLTASEFQEIVKANQGQWPSGHTITTNKTVLIFQSIDINGDRAIVKYDDGAALQEAILVRRQGQWLIASIVPIWVHF